ncbi:hypothetical protein VTK73DRAFT_8567 [Phialemonium thermophilum]|uniref:Uncharacterized protein n=1 Tax=Phialemonium thermophilum TaxID=223376 RepID=A0ABR3XNS1_9PEZI
MRGVLGQAPCATPHLQVIPLWLPSNRNISDLCSSNIRRQAVRRNGLCCKRPISSPVSFLTSSLPFFLFFKEPYALFTSASASCPTYHNFSQTGGKWKSVRTLELYGFASLPRYHRVDIFERGRKTEPTREAISGRTDMYVSE